LARRVDPPSCTIGKKLASPGHAPQLSMVIAPAVAVEFNWSSSRLVEQIVERGRPWRDVAGWQEFVRYLLKHMVREPHFKEMLFTTPIAPDQSLHPQRAVIDQDDAHSVKRDIVHIMEVEHGPQTTEECPYVPE